MVVIAFAVAILPRADGLPPNRRRQDTAFHIPTSRSSFSGYLGLSTSTFAAAASRSARSFSVSSIAAAPGSPRAGGALSSPGSWLLCKQTRKRDLGERRFLAFRDVPGQIDRHLIHYQRPG
ncbi:MAG: hypothetical protein H6810_11545 [Phycisphaeraceae bacterium]|nr:MAG: hypothetical protein H6810_11545 [Phycisphaeraceae bacterium]